MFLRFEAFGYFVELGALDNSGSEAVEVDAESLESEDTEVPVEHTFPLGFHVRGGGYDNEEV